MGKMSKFESCTYLGGLCEKRGKCLIEGTMQNQMLDGKSWIDSNSERVKQKMVQFIETAKKVNCLNQNDLKTPASGVDFLGWVNFSHGNTYKLTQKIGTEPQSD